MATIVGLVFDDEPKKGNKNTNKGKKGKGSKVDDLYPEETVEPEADDTAVTDDTTENTAVTAEDAAKGEAQSE